jgi:hypothetical protein
VFWFGFPAQGVPVTPRVFFPLAVLLVFFTTLSGFAQNLPDVSTVKDLPSTTTPSPKYQRLRPFSIHSQPDFLNSATSPALRANEQAAGLALANVISVPNFQGSFISRGKTWQFTMMGRAPWNGGTTSIPAHIVAVSLRLQNANLVTFTSVPVTAFDAPVLKSPNLGSQLLQRVGHSVCRCCAARRVLPQDAG